MHDSSNLEDVQKEWHGSLKGYLVGLLLSLILTVASFMTVVYDLLPIPLIVYALIGLAMLQAAIQLLFFLHLGQEPKPRWESLIFAFTFLILLIVVIGSLFIMHDLHMRSMANM